MRRLVLLTLLLIQSTFYCVLAQNSTGSSPDVYNAVYRLELPPGENKIITSNSQPNLSGSPFLEDWRDGLIIMRSNDTIKTLKLRFDFYNNDMQFMYEGKTWAIGAKNKIKVIKVGDHSFVYLPYLDNSQIKENYFEALSAGKVSILILYYPQIKPANYNAILNTGTKENQLLLKKKYYFVQDDRVVLMDKKGRNLISANSQKSKEIKEFIKNNKLSFTEETDLITIADFVNSLK